ncbi:MAG: LCP family protein [Bacilli bacterium]|nr:LCP family protein [Bacilli bacterium]
MAKRGRKSKKNRIITKLLIIISVIFIISVVYVDILPIDYLLYVIGGVILLDLVLILLNRKNKKRTKIITLIITLLMGLFSFYTLKTNGLINNLNLNYKTYNYSVIVLNTSKYKTIKDIKNKDLGYYKTDSKETTKSINKIDNIISTNKKEYTETSSLLNNLLNNKLDAILIEDTYLNMLEENNNDEENTNKIDNFKDKTKVIYRFTIRINTETISKDTDVTKKPFSIYISGIDTYGKISSVSRSDVNMVVTVNPNTNQILLTSIPRDYYVKLHGKTGYKDKLTHAGLYGVETSLKTIEDLLDIEINYYVKVNFTSVIDIVDAIGGVEVYSDYNFTSIDGYNYSKGYNKVNGEEALSFARERKAFSEGDRQRIKDQQALLEAMFRKCLNPSIITRYNSLLNSINGSFATNMPTNRLTSLIKMQLKNKDKWIITSNSLDGSNSSNYTYSYSASKLYVMEPNTESVENAKKLINSVINGETLESSYSDNPTNINKVTKNKPVESKPKEEKKEEQKEGLKVTLEKDKVTMTKGEEYIYYGYKATYNKEKIDDTKYELILNDKLFTDYKELVSYITNNLESGEYTIKYKITYKEETIIKEQKLTINKKEEPEITEEEPTNKKEPEVSNEETEEVSEENDTINE